MSFEGFLKIKCTINYYYMDSYAITDDTALPQSVRTVEYLGSLERFSMTNLYWPGVSHLQIHSEPFLTAPLLLLLNPLNWNSEDFSPDGRLRCRVPLCWPTSRQCVYICQVQPTCFSGKQPEAPVLNLAERLHHCLTFSFTFPVALSALWATCAATTVIYDSQKPRLWRFIPFFLIFLKCL